jgi:hypothetical protein
MRASVWFFLLSIVFSPWLQLRADALILFFDFMETPTPAPSQPATVAQLREVKFSLRQLLDEVEQERSTSLMAKQLVDQFEIQKMIRDKKKKDRLAQRSDPPAQGPVPPSA